MEIFILKILKAKKLIIVEYKVQVFSVSMLLQSVQNKIIHSAITFSIYFNKLVARFFENPRKKFSDINFFTRPSDLLC